MSEKAFKRALLISVAISTLLVAAFVITFGVLDIQCRTDPAGRFWNAETQHCQGHEIAD